MFLLFAGTGQPLTCALYYDCGRRCVPDLLRVICCRFLAHKAVTGLPHIRFYAAAPIVSSSGQRLGAL